MTWAKARNADSALESCLVLERRGGEEGRSTLGCSGLMLMVILVSWRLRLSGLGMKTSGLYDLEGSGKG